MVKKLYILLIALFLVTDTLIAQEKSEEQLVKEGSIRFMNYPRNKQNALLYDTIDPRGFYQIMQATFSEAYAISNIELKGISDNDVQKLKKCVDQPLSDLSYLESRLGPQGTTPLANMFNEDSAVRIPNLGTSYVYPERKNTYFICRKYDDLIIKEKKVFDSLSGKFTFVPIEIILRNRLCFSDKLIVTARIDVALLYQLGKTIYLPVETGATKQMIQDFETFLTNAEKRFGGTGCYQIIDFKRFFDFEREESKLFREKRHYGMGRDFVLNDLIKDEAFTIEKRDTSILVNEYGEDSLVFDKQTNEQLLEYRINIDTFYYVKSGFDKLYEEHSIYYDKLEKKWRDYPYSVFATKKVFTTSNETIVYEMDEEPGRKPFNYNNLRIPTITSYIKKQYSEQNNPLYKYLRVLPQTSFAQFPWEEKLYNHQFKGTILSSAEI